MSEVYGNKLSDHLRGTLDADQIWSRGGNDRVRADTGDDQVWGGAGSDSLRGQAGNDALSGGNDRDFLSGGIGDDTLYGGRGNDVLLAGGGHNAVYGGAGDDLLIGRQFTAYDGGDGVDTAALYLVHVQGDIEFTLDATAGVVNTLKGATIVNVEQLVLFTGSGNDKITGGALDDAFYGGAGDEQLNGMDGNDRLDGANGTDALWGGAGDDALHGGRGVDWLQGGLGADRYVYLKSVESSLARFDTIDGFDTAEDKFQFGFNLSKVHASVDGGDLADISTIFDHLHRHQAVLFRPDAGDHAGETFLIVEANNVTGFQAGADYLIKLTNGVGLDALSAANFLGVPDATS